MNNEVIVLTWCIEAKTKNLGNNITCVDNRLNHDIINVYVKSLNITHTLVKINIKNKNFVHLRTVVNYVLNGY